ncbi:MAG: YggT family protein [Chloroflexi bacterium]|nr:YggT family protein [Chloroflexota bacterium]
MIIFILVRLIDITAQLLVLLVIVSAVLSYFMSPYHSVRRMVDQIVEPLLRPIRQVVPLVGMFDFSPLILIILIQVLAAALTNLLYALS